MPLSLKCMVSFLFLPTASALHSYSIQAKKQSWKLEPLEGINVHILLCQGCKTESHLWLIRCHCVIKDQYKNCNEKADHKSGLVLGGGEGGKGWPSFTSFVTCLTDWIVLRKYSLCCFQLDFFPGCFCNGSKRGHKLHSPLARDGNILEQGFFFFWGKEKMLQAKEIYFFWRARESWFSPSLSIDSTRRRIKDQCIPTKYHGPGRPKST